MANKMFDFPQTKGSFQVRGIVNGVEKDSFYIEKQTKTGKEFRMINFGVEYDNKKTIFPTLNGMPRDKVYFSKKDKDTGNTDIKAIAWKDRIKKAPEGYRMIGVLAGLQKIKDENGKVRNDNKTLTEYDACEYISENLQDGDSVLVKGNIEFDSYIKNGDVVRTTKFIPNQVSLCKNDVDFEAEDYQPAHDFTQTIVFVGIDQEREDDKPTGRFIVEAKIVNYNSIESAEFIIRDSKLATLFKKNLKPYNSIQVYAQIDVVNNIEEANEEDSDDCWGETNKMDNKRVAGSSHRELVITGAKPTTIDRDTYSEKAISEAIKKINASKKAEQNFTGKAATTSNTDEDDDDWDSFDDDENDDNPWD